MSEPIFKKTILSMNYLKYLKKAGSRLCLVFLLVACHSALAADYIIYCSSTNSGAGDGSIGNPYKALSSITWASATAAAAAGNHAIIYLQNGSTFTGALTIGGSGIAGNPIVISNYAGATPIRPIISGTLSAITGWTNAPNGQGVTWGAPTTTFNLAETNGVPLIKGAGDLVLNNGEWYYNSSSNVLYYRNDVVAPTNAFVTFNKITDNNLVAATDRSYITWCGIQILNANSIGLYLAESSTACHDWAISNCVLSACGGWLTDLDSCTNITFIDTVLQYGMGSGGNIYIESNLKPNGVNFINCLICDSWGTRAGVTGSAASVVTFNDCTFAGCNNEFFKYAGSGVCAMTNCLLIASTSGNTQYEPVLINSSSGTFYVSDCAILGNGKSTVTNCLFQNCSLVGSIYYTDPVINNYRNIGWLSFITDDCAHANDWLDLATNYANGYGIPMGVALDWDQNFTTSLPNIQKQLLIGHEVLNHTRTHDALNTTNAFTLQDARTGVTTSTLSISNNNTLWITSNSVAKSYDLTATTNLYVKSLGTNLTAQGLTFSAGANQQTIYCTNLTNVSALNIFGSAPGVQVDNGRFLTNEIDYTTLAISNNFTNINGTAYLPRTLAYPYGAYDQRVINFLTNRFLGARSTVNNPEYGWQGINLYNMYIHQPFALRPLLTFENSLADVSPVGDDATWTAGSMTYDTVNPKRGIYSASFDGSSKYCYTTPTVYANVDAGDWQIASWVRPIIVSTNTIYAASCQWADVTKAVSNATANTTIILPPGGATWTNPIQFNMGLHFCGSGTNATFITNAIPLLPPWGAGTFDDSSPTNQPPLFYAHLFTNDQPFTVSDLSAYCQSNQFVLVDQTTDGWNPITNAMHGFKVRRCNIYNAYHRAVKIRAEAFGVIADDTFIDCISAGGSYGHDYYDWTNGVTAPYYYLGSSNNIVIERCAWVYTTNMPPNLGSIFSAGNGGHYIFRNNYYSNGIPGLMLDGLDVHGNMNYAQTNAADSRGSVSFECYSNVMYFGSDSFRSMNLRGGTCEAHDNKFYGGTNQTRIVLNEEEAWNTALFSPLRTNYPAQDQITNSYFWNNTCDVTNAVNIDVWAGASNAIYTFIQPGRDYFLQPPTNGVVASYYTNTLTYPHPVLQQNTLYYQGTDGSNNIAIAWGDEGEVSLTIKSNGLVKLFAATPGGMLSSNQWGRVRVDELFNDWDIRVNLTNDTHISSATRPAIYTGNQYIGCALDGAGNRTNYARGWLDSWHMANGTYRRTQALCAQLCDQNEFTCILSHGQDFVPNEVYDIIFHAVRDAQKHNGNLHVSTYSDMVQWMRNNGALIGNTNAFIPPTQYQDYRLQSYSPIIASGNTNALKAANLFDLMGTRITDANSNIVTSPFSIGAYQYTPATSPVTIAPVNQPLRKRKHDSPQIGTAY